MTSRRERTLKRYVFRRLKGHHIAKNQSKYETLAYFIGNRRMSLAVSFILTDVLQMSALSLKFYTDVDEMFNPSI